jgi:hypothetical protein
MRYLIMTIMAFALIASCTQVKEPVACTMDAKICPDGSAVGRDPDNNCEWQECPAGEKPEEGLGIATPYVQYVGVSREQCAATDWICPAGSSQFFDDTGCGCIADEPKKYVSDDPDQCALVKFMCEENRVPFFDESGCGCEYTFPSEETPSMPPAPGKLQAIDCSESRPEACTKEYMPVCGWYNQEIQCIQYPCAETYGNKCTACADEKVAYYTEGECPSGDDGVLR